MAADDYAILVGITLYPFLGDLQGAEGDAKRFREWLIDPMGGAVPPENVQLIVTSDFHPPNPSCVEDAEPAQDRFERAIRKLTIPGGIQRDRAGRRLYLYFSGHGFTTTKRPEAALYAASATFNAAEQIAGTRYLDRLKGAALFEELVLVMDCCRTEETMAEIFDPRLTLVTNTLRADRVKVFKAYGAPNGLPARERLFQPEGRVEGILTHALLAALRQAEGDAQGRVTGPQIKDHILNSWQELTRDVPAELPEIDVTHAAELVFAERTVSPLTRVMLEARNEPREGEVVIEDRPRSVAARVQLALGKGEAHLVPGFYKAIFAGTVKMFEVLGPQVEVHLDA